MSGTLPIPTAGQPHATEDVDVTDALTTLNGLLNSSNKWNWSSMAGTDVQAQLGVNDGSTVSRGVSSIATEETTTSSSYTTLTTPDRVQSVVLPTNGLLFVGFQGLWKTSAASAGKAAIFLGSNQLRGIDRDDGEFVQEASQGSGTGYTPIFSTPLGLYGGDSTGAGSTDFTTTTGRAIAIASIADPQTLIAGGVCAIGAAAGTYTISVQFKTSSGTLSAKKRTLWVWTAGF